MYLFNWRIDKKNALILFWFLCILGILGVCFSDKSSVGILNLLGIAVTPTIKLVGIFAIFIIAIIFSIFLTYIKEDE